MHLCGVQMVACCGVFQDGSLRVVRNGVGIHEAAAMELPGVSLLWQHPAAAAQLTVAVTHWVGCYVTHCNALPDYVHVIITQHTPPK